MTENMHRKGTTERDDVMALTCWLKEERAAIREEMIALQMRTLLLSEVLDDALSRFTRIELTDAHERIEHKQN